ncbi:MAG TPA: BCCT family transporter, partial [Arthrobacter sp.]|nr:BCCT family transporter [Arthrobacter sp.]
MALNSDIGLKSDGSSTEGTPPEGSGEPDGRPAAVVIDTLDPAKQPEAGEQILEELRQTEGEHAARSRTRSTLGLDKTIFGITGVLAIAFIVWGFIGTKSLSTTSQTALDWVMTNTGWLF